MISPNSIEFKYKQNEERLYTFLANNSNGYIRFMIGLAVFIALFYLIYFSDSEHSILDAGFRAFPSMARGLVAAIIISIIKVIFFPTKWWKFNFLDFVLIWSVVWTGVITQTMSLWLQALIWSSVPGICFLGYFCNSQLKRKTGIIFFIFVNVTFFLSLSWILYRYNEASFYSFWRLHPQFIFVSILTVLFLNDFRKDNFAIFFNPMNFIRGMLWPHDLRQTHTPHEFIKLWWRGMINVCLGVFLLSIVSFFKNDQFEGSFVVSLAGSLKVYISIFVSDIGFLNIIVGIVRLFGFTVRNPTDFVLFAKTPIEIWRRISVYNYLFVLTYVYLPLMRFIGVRFLVTFISFGVFFLNHYGFWNSVVLFMGPMGKMRHRPMGILYMDALQFIFMFLLIYFSRTNWPISIKKMQQPIWGWISIALTHLVFFGSHYVARALVFKYSGLWMLSL